MRDQSKQLLDIVLKQFNKSYRSHRIPNSSPAALMSENQILSVTESCLDLKYVCMTLAFAKCQGSKVSEVSLISSLIVIVLINQVKRRTNKQVAVRRTNETYGAGVAWWHNGCCFFNGVRCNGG